MLTGQEPLLTVGTITALVAAVITLSAAFGFPLSQAQTEAILGLVAVLAPIVVAVVARRHVTPVKSTRSVRGK